MFCARITTSTRALIQSSRGACRSGFATRSTMLAVIAGMSHTGLCLMMKQSVATTSAWLPPWEG